MSDLMERLDKLRALIQEPEFLEGKGLSNEVWYYIIHAAKASEQAKEKAPKSYSFIVTEKEIKRSETAIAGRDAETIWTEEKGNRNRAWALLRKSLQKWQQM